MSILIGKHIQLALSENKNISSLVGDSIYPMVAPMGVPKFPFICYQSGISSVDYTKDGEAGDTLNVAIAIISKTYSEAVDIAESVRYALERSVNEYELYSVQDCMLLSTNEDYLEQLDAYRITLNFELQTINY